MTFLKCSRFGYAGNAPEDQAIEKSTRFTFTSVFLLIKFVFNIDSHFCKLLYLMLQHSSMIDFQMLIASKLLSASLKNDRFKENFYSLRHNFLF